MLHDIVIVHHRSPTSASFPLPGCNFEGVSSGTTAFQTTVSDDSSDGKTEERFVITNSTPRASRLFRKSSSSAFDLIARSCGSQARYAHKAASIPWVRVPYTFTDLAACLRCLPPNVHFGWQMRSNWDYRSYSPEGIYFVLSPSRFPLLLCLVCYLGRHLDNRAPWRLMVAHYARLCHHVHASAIFRSPRSQQIPDRGPTLLRVGVLPTLDKIVRTLQATDELR